MPVPNALSARRVLSRALPTLREREAGRGAATLMAGMTGQVVVGFRCSAETGGGPLGLAEDKFAEHIHQKRQKNERKCGVHQRAYLDTRSFRKLVGEEPGQRSPGR